MSTDLKRGFTAGLCMSAIGLAAAASFAQAPSPAEIAARMAAMQQQHNGDSDDKPDFPDYKDVVKDYEKVISTADGAPSLYTIYRRDKDQQLLAEFPRNFEQQRLFFAMTIAGGTQWAGLQGADIYCYWKRFNKQLALIMPNLGTRSTGDMASKDSVNQLFTDRVLLSVPILTMSPGGGPVIDLDALLVGQASNFFGPIARGLNAKLATIASAKAFPQNVEISVEAPVSGAGAGGFFASNLVPGRLLTFHYSISAIKPTPGFKPRVADSRVGYFTTVYRDLGKLGSNDKWVRYINRWNLQKADPKLKMSPPKKPLVFYIEHTVPVRYRRWVREGILRWNKAYEQVGLAGAIEVYYQDKTSGAHMEKDPEDVRYNFIRWLSNDISTAIGPSRADPLTGEILDADIILTDGWIRAFWTYQKEILPDIALDGMNPQTLAWLDNHPDWDPRILLAPPAQRNLLLSQRAQRGALPFGGHPAAMVDPTLMGDDKFDGLYGHTSQMNGMCLAAEGKAFDMATMGMALEMLGAVSREEGDKPSGEGGSDDEKGDVLDGIPEWFIGPMLADVVAHEVGHTLGLRHNFKASSVYSMAQINSEEFKGKKPMGGSVMDYNALPNINMESGKIQGDFQMIDIGPYDMWAINYGYTFGDTKPILAETSKPEHVYGTDEDTWGPDPLARRRDMGANPLDFAKDRIKLVNWLREHLSEKFVKDGDSWAKARRGYSISLGQQFSAVRIMAGWVGGDFVARDKKGDPNARKPIVVVPASKQRAALKFVCENAFRDDAFGLTPELLNIMTVDKWFDQGGFRNIFEDESWPVHQRILALQATTLTMLMNPTTLGRVYDNEFRVSADQDMITLPEVVSTITKDIWSELGDYHATHSYTDRKPLISSLRRNLQSAHLERLIALTLPDSMFGSAGNAIGTIATHQLRMLRKKIGKVLNSDNLDPYTTAHLSEAQVKIDKALDAVYIYNANKIGNSNVTRIILGNEGQPAGHR